MSVNLPVEQAPSAPALTLRPWRVEDAPGLVVAHRDPSLQRWLAHHLNDEAQALRWIGEQTEGRVSGARFSFAVVEEGRPVGHVAVKRAGRAGSAEVGYWTAGSVRGRGVASRALEALSRWALGPESPLAVTRLELLHTVGNEGSCRVAQKCGYALESVLPPLPPAYPGEGHLHVRGA
ncbi:acetyltransferase [Streptomyces spiroverticillatus]|uniref:Acetyltransferase n=1 Tax=Streptomyces finlayi TaxID=67296 RepID=A0A919CCH4_9ACTN|nr:GNAT family N-acetyltransferase [Streptomyces finlayi]GHA23685.1 acetyltransferase [Streptomyces spiroverticillatus]GHD04891.1 acetyltransferase [Streptomyces finlayi]